MASSRDLTRRPMFVLSSSFGTKFNASEAPGDFQSASRKKFYQKVNFGFLAESWSPRASLVPGWPESGRKKSKMQEVWARRPKLPLPPTTEFDIFRTFPCKFQFSLLREHTLVFAGNRSRHAELFFFARRSNHCTGAPLWLRPAFGWLFNSHTQTHCLLLMMPHSRGARVMNFLNLFKLKSEEIFQEHRWKLTEWSS